MKKLLVVLLAMFCVLPLFAKSYSEYLAEAKKYEEQKRWCYALGSYYDAMGTDELPENKLEAYESYSKLKNAIISGNPGFGKFNEFTIHDEWKNLLIDAEKYGSSISIYDITVGPLERGALDYTTRTATYNAKVDYKIGERYNKTIQIIEEGYKKAYEWDWTDLPNGLKGEWPLYSVSSKHDSAYNVNGALIYARKTASDSIAYINAFYQFKSKDKFIWIENKRIDMWSSKTPSLYDYKFNIVDENGNELVKGKRWLLGDGDKISFSGITPELMDIIDSGKAFVTPVGCYLQYGEYNSVYDKGGRTFMKNFPEVQLSMDKMVFICWNNQTDKIAENCFSTENYGDYSAISDIELITIDDLQIQFLKTEVTQRLYKAVMGENPSYFWGDDLPVEGVSFDDMFYFCNKLSEIKGLTPVYSVNGSTNVADWNYTPHKGKEINSRVEENELADGFRLPTNQEWIFAAKGGEDYEYAGSSDIEEVAWYKGNSGSKTHPVAQKKANSYGLYDMNGNVAEMCSDFSSRGGAFNDYMSDCRIASGFYSLGHNIGFRIVRTIK